MAKRDRKPIIRNEPIEIDPSSKEGRAKLKELGESLGPRAHVDRIEGYAKEYLTFRGLPAEYLNTSKQMPPGTPEGDARQVLMAAAGVRDSLTKGNAEHAASQAFKLQDAFWRMVIRAGIEDDALTGREVKAGASEAGRARAAMFNQERERIIAMADGGLSAGQIAPKVGKSREAVKKTIQRHRSKT